MRAGKLLAQHAERLAGSDDPMSANSCAARQADGFRCCCRGWRGMNFHRPTLERRWRRRTIWQSCPPASRRWRWDCWSACPRDRRTQRAGAARRAAQLASIVQTVPGLRLGAVLSALLAPRHCPLRFDLASAFGFLPPCWRWRSIRCCRCCAAPSPAEGRRRRHPEAAQGVA